MPELPEVETVARQLAPLLTARSIRKFEIRDEVLRDRVPLSLDGTIISSVFREGKQIVFEITPVDGPAEVSTIRRPPTGQRRRPGWLAIHLRMTGRLLWSSTTSRSNDRARADFLFDHGRLAFVDTRRFGTIDWHDEKSTFRSVGIDPLGPSFGVDELRALIGSSKQQIKAWLLRQDRICGIGNIYASEILAEAELSPFHEAGALDRRRLVRLHESIRKVLREAIEHCGTTFSDFQDSRGVTGEYQNYLRVYGREGLACRACGYEITRIVQGGRSTFFCERCAPPPTRGIP